MKKQQEKHRRQMRRVERRVRHESEIKELARMVYADLKRWDCNAACEAALRLAGYRDDMEPYGA